MPAFEGNGVSEVDAYLALWNRVYHRKRLSGWSDDLARERADKAVSKRRAEDQRWQLPREKQRS